MNRIVVIQLNCRERKLEQLFAQICHETWTENLQELARLHGGKIETIIEQLRQSNAVEIISDSDGKLAPPPSP